MRRPDFFVLAALVSIALYSRTATFGFVHADDADLIAGNQAFLSDLRNVPPAFARSYFEVEGELTAQKTYYRPAAIVSFMLDAARAGADPRAYHRTNIVLHAAASCLLLALALAWGAPAWASCAAALVFAVHPVNVQAVAWIAGRNDLLLTAAGLASLIAWRRAGSEVTAFPTTSRARIVRSAATSGAAAGAHVITFALALFSKETGVFIPVLALAHQRLVARATLTREHWIALGADAVVVLVWAAARATALSGQPPELTADSLRAAVMNSPQLLLHAGKMLAPVALNVTPGVDAAGVALGAAAVALYAWLVPPRHAAFGAIWALAFLLPTLLVAGLPAYEHRAYLPLAGILLAMVDAIRTRSNTLSLVGCAVLCGALAVLAYHRQPVFRDPRAYWTDAARDPRFGAMANVNLGQLYEADGRLAEARREYLRALERDPNTPKAHNDLGVVLMKLDEPELALTHFREESRRHPWNADAWFNLGLFAEMRGDAEAARRQYERAIEANRAYAPAYEKLGLTTPRRR